MALPTNKIKKIKLPNSTEAYEIIPERLQNNGFEASLPTLSTNSTIALLSDIPRFKTVNGNSIIGSGDLEIKPSRPDIIEALTNKISEETYPSLYDRDSIRVRSDGDDYQTALKSNGFNLYNMGVSDEPVAIDLRYKSGTVALTSDIPTTLPDYNLGYYDTITANSDGSYTITRQTGYVDLGSLDFGYYAGVFYCLLPTKASSGSATNWLNSKYGNAPRGADISIAQDKTMQITQSGEYISIKDTTFTDPNAFKVSVAGVMLQYELATATTEKVEANHYAQYNQRFILEHNKSEAERSCNLLDVPNKTITEQGITFTISNGVINVNGSSAASTYPECPINSVELQAGTYTINKSVDNTGLYMWVGSSIRNNDIVNTYSKSATFTITTNMRVYITLVSTQSQTYSNFKFSLMLNEGTEPLPYRPYNQNKHITNYEANFLKTETDRSANLFDINTITIGNGYDYTATATDWVKAIDIPVEPNTTYTASYPIARYAFNHGDIVADYNKNTITTGSDTKTLSIFIYIGSYSGTARAWFSNYMLNKGSIAYPYQAYNGEIVHDKDIADLYKQEYNLGYYDTMAENSDGSYTITRQTGYIILDGVENKFGYKMGSTINAEYAYEGAKPYVYKPTNIDIKPDIISNNFETMSANALYSANVRGISLDSSGTILVGFTTSVSTLEDANAYLVQNPIYIQYKLATATTEKVEANHYARYNERFILEHNKSEAERSANLFDDNGTNSIQYIGHYFISSSYNLSSQNDYNCFRIRVEQNKTYYIKQIGELILRYEDINNNVLGGNANFYKSGYGAFTTPSRCNYVVFSKAISYTTNATMLNEGTEPLPYQPYEGKVVHEKELKQYYKAKCSDCTASMQIYNLTGRYYDNYPDLNKYMYLGATITITGQFYIEPSAPDYLYLNFTSDEIDLSSIWFYDEWNVPITLMTWQGEKYRAFLMGGPDNCNLTQLAIYLIDKPTKEVHVYFNITLNTEDML